MLLIWILENLLKKIFIKQTEAADRKDPDLLKFRTEVVGLRRCNILKCTNQSIINYSLSYLHTTLRQSSKLSFGKRCVGCKVARYCGQDYQRDDWKKGGHRLVCKVFETSGDEGKEIGEET